MPHIIPPPIIPSIALFASSPLTGPVALLALIGIPLNMALIGLLVAWLLDIPYVWTLSNPMMQAQY